MSVVAPISSRSLAALSAFFLAPQQGAPASDRLNAHALAAAASFAQSLAQWEFVMIGASVLLLVGTGYHRPKEWWARCSYLLFLPAWGLLACSIYRGERAQEAYLAYLLLPKPSIGGVTMALNADLGTQISLMWIGLACLATWLLVYLAWWIAAGETTGRGAHE